MKMTIQKQEDVFHPADNDSFEYMQKIKENDLYVIEIKRQRNPRFHRRAMAVFRELFDMVDETIGFEPWRKLMLIKAGYFTSLGKVSIQGATSVAIEAKSMSYERMDQDEFKNCFSDVLNAFGEKYGRELTLDQLEAWSRF